MKVSARRGPTATILDVSGNIDMSNSPEMRKALLEELRQKDVKPVALNLTSVNYIDSSGVASLVEALKVSRERGSRLILFGLNESSKEVLKISRLLKLFEIYDNEQEAIAAT